MSILVSVHGTETIPSNRADNYIRLRRFSEAVKLAHPSALSRQPRGRVRSIGRNLEP
jgi:hypothetical protein